MFHKLGLDLLRRQVHVMQRSSFNKAYCFEWNAKTGCATLLRKGRKYRYFQVIYLSFTFLVLPASLIRSFQIFTSNEQPSLETGFAYAFTFFILTFAPISWVLITNYGALKYIKIFQATLTFDKTLSGVFIYLNF